MFHHGAWLIISCGGVRKFHTNNSLLVAATTLPAYASFNHALSPSQPSHAAMVDECLRGYQDRKSLEGLSQTNTFFARTIEIISDKKSLQIFHSRLYGSAQRHKIYQSLLVG